MHNITPTELLQRLKEASRLYEDGNLLGSFRSIKAFAVGLLIDDITNMSEAEKIVADYLEQAAT